MLQLSQTIRTKDRHKNEKKNREKIRFRDAIDVK